MQGLVWHDALVCRLQTFVCIMNNIRNDIIIINILHLHFCLHYIFQLLVSENYQWISSPSLAQQRAICKVMQG